MLAYIRKKQSAKYIRNLNVSNAVQHKVTVQIIEKLSR